MSAVVLHASTVDHDRWDGPRRYVRIVLHDTTKELREAASRYRGGEDFGDAGGVFHPADTVWLVQDDGSRIDAADRHWTGVLRLSREHLTTEVVTHECIHAAATIYRMDIIATINLGNGCREREETFAYIAGHLIARVTDALHDAEAWQAAALNAPMPPTQRRVGLGRGHGPLRRGGPARARGATRRAGS